MMSWDVDDGIPTSHIISTIQFKPILVGLMHACLPESESCRSSCVAWLLSCWLT